MNPPGDELSRCWVVQVMNPPGDESAGDESAGDESAGDESAGHPNLDQYWKVSSIAGKTMDDIPSLTNWIPQIWVRQNDLEHSPWNYRGPLVRFVWKKAANFFFKPQTTVKKYLTVY